METENTEENTAVLEESASPQEDTSQQGVQDDKETNFKAVRDKLSQQEREIENYKYQLNELSQKVSQQQQPVEPQPHEEDLVTYGSFNKTVSDLENRYKEIVGDLQVKSKFNDYDEVVTDSNVLALVDGRPELREAIRTSSNPRVLAYSLIKAQQKPKSSQQQQQNAKQILENSQKPGAMGNAPSGTGSVSQVNRITSMSDAEFNEYAAEVKRKMYANQ